MLRIFTCLFCLLLTLHADAAEIEHRHAMSLIRAPRYGPDFKYFDYVNPDAPKGGIVKLAAGVTYDNLNAAIFKGALAPGLRLNGGSLVNETLMAPSLDEAGTAYCLLCEWVSFPPDYSAATFKLRDSARWHDGTPVTPSDVVFSMETMKSADLNGFPYNPRQALYYKNVIRGEETGPGEVTFTFDTKGNRELPFIVGELTVFPKKWWTGAGADGKPRDISKPTVEFPLGSGPYKVKSAQPGSTIAFERVTDYWGSALPSRIGQDNFDTIQFQYYGDPGVALEAFKAGQYDFRVENSAKSWATAYEFPALKEGRVVKRDNIALKVPQPMQGYVFNLRRTKFQDVRVRKALALAFDFEWANQNLFYGQYTRTSSYFQGQELAATGLPSNEELALLEPLRDKLPPEIFSQEFKNPENPTQVEFRKHLREAAGLLKDAGWQVSGSQLKNANGEAFTVEFLIDTDQWLRIILPYIENLRKLGVEANVRQVDSTEQKRREDAFDFDMIVQPFRQSESPGNEQRDFWGSVAARQPGSQNVMGIENPAVDALIDKIIFAKDRDALATATRALDRVLLWNNYIVPHWHTRTERVAYWNKFAAPTALPSRSIGFPDVWWYDPALAARSGIN